MARIRTIKPELLEDEIAAGLSDAAWRLFVSAWLLADDQGNLRAGTRYLAASVWQDTGRDSLTPLIELAGKERLLVYEADGQRYANIPNWHRHQRVDNAGKPRVPEPPENVRELTRVFAANRGKFPRDAESLGISPLDPDHDPDHDPDQGTRGESRKNSRTTKIRATRIPEDWKPPEELYAWAREDPDVRFDRRQVDRFLGEFVDYWLSRTKDPCRVYWDRVFKNRLREMRLRHPNLPEPRPEPKGPPPAPPPRHPDIQRRADELQLELAGKSPEEQAAIFQESLGGIGQPKRAAGGTE